MVHELNMKTTIADVTKLATVLGVLAQQRGSHHATHAAYANGDM